MPEYRFTARDLRTGDRLGELPLADVTYGERLNGVGDLTASVDLAARSRTGVRLSPSVLAATVPRRSVIWVQRDGRLMDGYIVWRRSTSNAGRTLRLQCGSLWSYFGCRILTVTKSYTAVDQLAIARDLIGWAQSRPGGDIGVVVGSETSGVARDRQPIGFSYERKVIGTLVEQLADVQGGFDFAVTAAFNADVPEATFRCFYPRRGRRASQNNIVFRSARNGNLIDYTHDEDGLGAATTIYGIGAGEGTDMLLNTRADTSLIDAGYPLQEATISHKDVSVMSTLNGHTEAELARRATTPVTWKLVVDPDDASVSFGSWTVGDDCRVIVDDDDRFPAGAQGEPGADTTLRILAQTVTVPNDGGPDRVELEMGSARG